MANTTSSSEIEKLSLITPLRGHYLKINYKGAYTPAWIAELVLKTLVNAKKDPGKSAIKKTTSHIYHIVSSIRKRR